MDRRRALKNIGLGAGFLVATPTVFSLLQSCAKEVSFSPVFLSPGQAHALTKMVDLIIPSDDQVAGAIDIGADKFIDAYWKEVIPREQDMAVVKINGEYRQLQQHIELSWKLLEEYFLEKYGRTLDKGTPEDFDDLLKTTFAIDKPAQQEHYIKIGNFYKEYDRDPTAMLDKDASVFGLLSDIRGMTVWAWKTSEEIGKNILWYDPIPGQQKGCIPLDEAGNGKVMSL